MNKIKLNHYAHNEGRAGYANGCALHDNPYYGEDGNVTSWDRAAFDHWRTGWKEREAEMIAKAKADRQARMGYDEV